MREAPHEQNVHKELELLDNSFAKLLILAYCVATAHMHFRGRKKIFYVYWHRKILSIGKAVIYKIKIRVVHELNSTTIITIVTCANIIL